MLNSYPASLYMEETRSWILLSVLVLSSFIFSSEIRIPLSSISERIGIRGISMET